MKYEENVATRKSTVRGTVNEPTYGIVYTLCSKKHVTTFLMVS